MNLVLASWAWYDRLMEYIPSGQTFSLRAVFNGIPEILSRLPITLSLTFFGALFGLLLALLFAIVKINKTKMCERFAVAKILGGSDSRYFECFISVALVYWVISIIIEQIGNFVERRMAIKTPETITNIITEGEH